MDNSEKKFGGFLKMVRKRKNLTLRQVEELSGVSYSYLAQVESGKRGAPSPEVLAKLSESLGVSYDELMIRAGRLKYNYSYQYPFMDSKTPSRDNIQALFVFGRNLNRLRNEKGLSSLLFSRIVGLSSGDIEEIEKGNYDLSADTLKKIANALDSNYEEMMFDLNKLSGFDMEAFIQVAKSVEMKKNLVNAGVELIQKTLDDNDKEKTELLKRLYMDAIIQIPIYGTIKAGYDYVAEQNIVGYKLTSKSEVSDGEYFYLVVKGDSMIDEGIREGYHVLVRKQTFVESGKIGVVILNGDEATLKRVYYQGDQVILQAANKSIPPRVVNVGDVMIQGQVKSVVFDV